MFRILIVEDDTELCRLFSHVLEKNGHAFLNLYAQGVFYHICRGFSRHPCAFSQ